MGKPKRVIYVEVVPVASGRAVGSDDNPQPVRGWLRATVRYCVRGNDPKLIKLLGIGFLALCGADVSAIVPTLLSALAFLPDAVVAAIEAVTSPVLLVIGLILFHLFSMRRRIEPYRYDRTPTS